MTGVERDAGKRFINQKEQGSGPREGKKDTPKQKVNSAVHLASMQLMKCTKAWQHGHHSFQNRERERLFKWESGLEGGSRTI